MSPRAKTTPPHRLLALASELHKGLEQEFAGPTPIAEGEQWRVRLPGEGRLRSMAVEKITAACVQLKMIVPPRPHDALSGWYARDEVRFVERCYLHL